MLILGKGKCKQVRQKGLELVSVFGLSKVVGIDLGTTNLRIVVNQSIKEVVEVDELARQLAVNRPFKHGVPADYTALEAILNYAIRVAVGRLTVFRPTVRLSLSETATSTEKIALTDAMSSTGVKEPALLSPAFAAAMALRAESKHSPEGMCILDMGAGTSEICLSTSSQVVASDGIRMGGNILDQNIKQYLKKRFRLQISSRQARDIRELANTKHPSDTVEVSGKNLTDSSAGTIDLSVRAIELDIEKQAQEIKNMVKRVFDKAPPEIIGDISQVGILCVGGLSNQRAILEYLSKSLNIPFIKSPNPTTRTAAGLVVNATKLRS